MNEAEEQLARLATISLLHALASGDPIKAASRASAILRRICHDKPYKGGHIRGLSRGRWPDSLKK